MSDNGKFNGVTRNERSLWYMERAIDAFWGGGQCIIGEEQEEEVEEGRGKKKLL